MIKNSLIGGWNGGYQAHVRLLGMVNRDILQQNNELVLRTLRLSRQTLLERYDQGAHYSLVVLIRAPGVDVVLYTAIENQVAIAVET